VFFVYLDQLTIYKRKDLTVIFWWKCKSSLKIIRGVIWKLQTRVLQIDSTCSRQVKASALSTLTTNMLQTDRLWWKNRTLTTTTTKIHNLSNIWDNSVRAKEIYKEVRPLRWETKKSICIDGSKTINPQLSAKLRLAPTPSWKIEVKELFSSKMDKSVFLLVPKTWIFFTNKLLLNCTRDVRLKKLWS
jgi:hypothetical protein